MLIRCFYVANSYDGAYFVLTDNMEEYIQKMASYVLNLESSGKTNHYSFGSIEMAKIEFDRHRTEARRLESSLVQQKKEEKEIAASEVPAAITKKENEGPEKKPSHLRLV